MLRTDSVVDVAEQIQIDYNRLSPERKEAYDKCMTAVRQAIKESPEMAVGVIFEIAGQMLIDSDNHQVN